MRKYDKLRNILLKNINEETWDKDVIDLLEKLYDYTTDLEEIEYQEKTELFENICWELGEENYEKKATIGRKIYSEHPINSLLERVYDEDLKKVVEKCL